jgi:dipeptidase D
MTIKDLQPREVWKHFEALTQVPRPSGHLEKIQKYLLDFGKSINVETWQDEAGNIIMRKPATPGLENRKGIILQAHMDMVPQKTPDSKHDFVNDPITTVVKGDWLYADNTTLGADNGLGVAAIMAIMEDSTLQHGPLEALITADEETGMYGAFGLKGGELEGSLLLNLDSEEEGVLYIGCAGGLDITASMEFMEEESDDEDVAVKVQLKGLRGGHSGLEINAGRGNANKLMARFMREAMDECGVVLASWNGGNMRNAIPASCEVVLTLPAEGVEELKAIAAKYEALYNSEYATIEEGITLTVVDCEMPETVGEFVRLTGTLPAARLGDYPEQVAAYSHGAGQLQVAFCGYAPCHNEAAVIEEIGYQPEADLENTPDSVFCDHGAGVTVKWNDVEKQMHIPYETHPA